MKVTIDDDRCKGHGVCCAVCPEVFTMTDDGYSVAREEVPAGSEKLVFQAVDNCPERAITAT